MIPLIYQRARFGLGNTGLWGFPLISRLVQHPIFWVLNIQTQVSYPILDVSFISARGPALRMLLQ